MTLESPQPNDIDTSSHLWSTFGHRETEITAKWIVRLCKKRGTGWAPFTREEINEFYTPSDGFWFNGLLNDVWLADVNGQIDILPEFVRCVSEPFRYEKLSISVVGKEFYS